MKTVKKKISYIVLLCGFCICLNAFGRQITFDININNQLNSKISVSPTKDFSTLVKSTGKIISKSSDEEQSFPSLVLEEVIIKGYSVVGVKQNNLELSPFKEIKFFATINDDEINLEKINVTEKPFIIQRLLIKDEDKGKTIGYISFRCSVYNFTPTITIESGENHTIAEEQMPFGGGGIHLVISNL